MDEAFTDSPAAMCLHADDGILIENVGLEEEDRRALILRKSTQPQACGLQARTHTKEANTSSASKYWRQPVHTVSIQ
jgi:hypothetical protein